MTNNTLIIIGVISPSDLNFVLSKVTQNKVGIYTKDIYYKPFIAKQLLWYNIWKYTIPSTMIHKQ